MLFSAVLLILISYNIYINILVFYLYSEMRSLTASFLLAGLTSATEQLNSSTYKQFTTSGEFYSACERD